MKVILEEKNSGLNKKNTPPQCKHMEAFEKEFLDMIPNIKFRSVTYISEEVKKGHSKDKTVTKLFCLRRQNK